MNRQERNRRGPKAKHTYGEYVGKTFGRLTVELPDSVNLTDMVPNISTTKVPCRCSCNNEVNYYSIVNLLNGKSYNCKKCSVHKPFSYYKDYVGKTVGIFKINKLNLYRKNLRNISATCIRCKQDFVIWTGQIQYPVTECCHELNRKRDDVTLGAVFGHWTVIKAPDLSLPRSQQRCTCKCKCGTIRPMAVGNLLYNQSQGCLRCSLMDSNDVYFQKEIGKTYGNLLVKNIVRDESQNIRVICKCVICNRERDVSLGELHRSAKFSDVPCRCNQGGSETTVAGVIDTSTICITDIWEILKVVLKKVQPYSDFSLRTIQQLASIKEIRSIISARAESIRAETAPLKCTISEKLKHELYEIRRTEKRPYSQLLKMFALENKVTTRDLIRIVAEYRKQHHLN